jgi:peptide-methionine (R)-S-oxide reductase
MKSLLKLLPVFIFLFAGCVAQAQKNNPYYSRTDTKKLNVTDAEWKKVLDPNVYYIARQEGTERAFTGPYHDNHQAGTYYCKACGNLLFRSTTKFESGTGWPSFYKTAGNNSVKLTTDADGSRTEVSCARCAAHLGHVFDDGPEPTGKRFCMNGTVLDFIATK